MPKTIKFYEYYNFVDDLDSKRNCMKDETLAHSFLNLHERLHQAISKNDVASFSELLLIPCIINSKVTKSEYYEGGHHVRETTTYKCRTRPLCEYLFFKNNNLFLDLIEKLKCCSANFQEAFIEKLEDTDLKGLSNFLSVGSMGKIKEGINALQTYGERLQEKKIDRGKYAVTLSHKLSENLQYIEDNKKEPHAINKLNCLAAKIHFAKDLHSKDAEFIKHRGYKRLIVNIASIMFTAGIANVFQRCYTGNWLFFNKTTTQELVSDIDVKIDNSENFTTIARHFKPKSI